MAKKTGGKSKGGKKGSKKRKSGGGGGSHHGGVMTSMRGGMKRAVGAPGPERRKASPWGSALTVALLLAVLALLFWQFAG